MIEYLFQEDGEYGSEDVNRALGALATPGVIIPLKLSAGVPGASFSQRTVDHLNLTALSVRKNGEAYQAAPGSAIFGDGCIVTISQAEPLNPKAGVRNYVYLQRAEASNNSLMICSERPATGEFIPLAEISPSGEIVDRRILSNSRLRPNCFNIHQEIILEGSYRHYDSTVKKGTVLTEKAIAWNGFTQAVVWATHGEKEEENTSRPTHSCHINYLENWHRWNAAGRSQGVNPILKIDPIQEEIRILDNKLQVVHRDQNTGGDYKVYFRIRVELF